MLTSTELQQKNRDKLTQLIFGLDKKNDSQETKLKQKDLQVSKKRSQARQIIGMFSH